MVYPDRAMHHFGRDGRQLAAFGPRLSKTSRPGLSRETSVSCSARNGIVTRASSPLTKIVVASEADSTLIMTRPVRGRSWPAAPESGPHGGLILSAAALFGPLISGAPARNDGTARTAPCSKLRGKERNRATS